MTRRITFIENRGKTAFWVKVSALFQARGHQISWIVQNPVYAPKPSGQQVVLLPFPSADQLTDADIPEAVSTDRGRDYFEAGSGHYAHYQKHIDQALEQLRPDVVIGEPTLFHELLTIAACKQRDIPYLHPTMNRYPSGRFQILQADTQHPVAGSNEQLDVQALNHMVEMLTAGNSLPSYMRVPGAVEKQIRRLRRMRAHMQVIRGRWQGEKFNTPSISRKAALERQLKENLAAWRMLQRVPDTASGPVILYPLQMQPEANIDVWGRPFSDQTEFVERLLAALPEDGQVAIKANPKSKYEVSEQLIALARRESRVVLLPLNWRMPEAHKIATGAVTVCGTVGYEAVFGRGRCISLRHPIIQRLFPTLHADSPEEAVNKLLAQADAGQGTPDMTRQLISALVAESYPGTINEPLYDPDCLRPENIEKVANAFEQVFTAYELTEAAE